MLDPAAALDAAVRVATAVAVPLATTALRASVVLAVTWAAQRTLGRRVSASTRHAAWVAAVLIVLALPIAEHPAIQAATPSVAQIHWLASGSDLAPTETAPQPTATPSLPDPTTDAPSAGPHGASPLGDGATEGDHPPPLGSKPPPTLPLPALLVLFWAVGATFALARSARSASLAARAVRRSVPDAILTGAVGHPVRRASDGVVPYVWGLVRPVVVVPADFDAWPEPARRAALAHEAAHARRRDALTGVVARVARALHWFDPLAHLAVRRLDRERERAADDAVLSAETGPVEYAGLLIATARRVLTSSPTLAPAYAEPACALDERVRALLDGTTRRQPPGRRVTLAGGAALLTLAASLSAFGVSGDHSFAATNTALALVDRADEPGWYHPPSTAERWAPELHVADGWTYTPTFTPDLRTAYFVLWPAPDYARPTTSIQELRVTRWSDADGAWSPPERVAATEGWRVDWPHVSPDGSRLFVSTTKPHPGHYGAADGRSLPARTADFDLWSGALDAGGALDEGTLTPLRSPDLNRQKTPENARRGYVHNETAPRTDRAGRLYFWTERLDDGGGRRDVYAAEPDAPGPDGAPRWRAPRLLPFNTARQESGVAVDPDGRWLIFASEGRGGAGHADLFLTVREGDGWGTPVNLGPRVNTRYREDSPEVSPDGRTLFFSTNRPGPGVPIVDAGEGAGPAASVFWVDLLAVPAFTSALGARPDR